MPSPKKPKPKAKAKDTTVKFPPLHADIEKALWAVWHSIMRGTPQIYPARLNPTWGGKLAARPVPRRCLAKALTNSLGTWALRSWGSAAEFVPVKNVYLVHKVLPLETKDRVVGVLGTSKSVGVTSYVDFVPVASHERGVSCCHSSNSGATTSLATNRQASQQPLFGPTPQQPLRNAAANSSSLLPLRSDRSVTGNHSTQQVKRTDRRSHVY